MTFGTVVWTSCPHSGELRRALAMESFHKWNVSNAVAPDSVDTEAKTFSILILSSVDVGWGDGDG